MDITKELFKLQDLKYKEFHQKLIPTVDPNTIIGVRIPELRKLAKKVFETGEMFEFLDTLPHKYYEENNLHAFLIEEIRDFYDAVYMTEDFLPYIDNWATCDSFRPKVFAKFPAEILEHIEKWLNSDKPYTVRYAIGLLESYFLDENFYPEWLVAVGDVKSDNYYVNMMMAWFFATALSKQYDSAIEFLKKNTLPEWVHNKTIQKAIESRRIDDKTKEYLKTLKR